MLQYKDDVFINPQNINLQFKENVKCNIPGVHTTLIIVHDLASYVYDKIDKGSKIGCKIFTEIKKT